MATNTNGIIYYKLDANIHGYEGDITKNCGLRGEEIDGNFNFLRGNDIKNIEFDEKGTLYLTKHNGEILSATQVETPEFDIKSIEFDEKGTLYLTKHDGEILSAEQVETPECECECEYDFEFDKNLGILTIKKPDGNVIVLDGFKMPTNSIFHDYTITGDGSYETPLSLANIIKTGRYRPAIKLIDTTNSDETLPTENITKHDRYVTKEKVSRFGKLYPLSGVEAIEKRLKEINSEWHVASKEEWDELLNAIDCANPNHDNTISNVELGEFAGSALKAVGYWKENEDGKVLSEDSYGFSIFPVGYCGNRGKNYYGSFGEATAFWTTTVEDNHKDMFVKTFDYDKETVGQRTWGENYYLSVRLVKKFTGNNFCDVEVIDGFTSACVHVPGTNLIWTKENISFSQPQYDGFTPEEWAQFENNKNVENSYTIRYFVNDWNGVGWDRQEIKEGEGIVLYEGDNGAMHEWLLVDGELIDSALLIKNEFNEILEKAEKALQEEIAQRIEADNQILASLSEEVKNREEVNSLIWESFENETKRAQEVEGQLWDNVNGETARAQEVEAQLWDNVNGEIARAQEAEAQLWTAINTESATRETSVKEALNTIVEETNRAQETESQLWNAINDEIARSTEIEGKLWNSINGEITERKETDTNLWNNISNETARAQEVEGQLWTAINTEIENRQNADTQLLDTINIEAENRQKSDFELTNSLVNEIERATGAENEIRQSVNDLSEKVDNAKVDSTKELNSEIGRVEAIISVETLRAIDAENEIREHVDVVETNLRDKDIELDTKIANNTALINANKVTSSGKTIVISDATENGTNIEVNIDEKTIIADENGVLSVVSDALVQYEGENAIKVSDVNRGVKNISLAINPNDKILTNDVQGLLATLALKWVHGDSTGQKDEIQLIGKDNIVISRIDIADFIKDGILDNVSLNTDDTKAPYLSFTFNSSSGKEVINVPVKDLVDIYYAGDGLVLTENTFSVKIDKTSEMFLSITSEGIKLYGIENAIDNAKNEVITLINTETTELQNSINQLDNELTKLNGDITVDGSVKDIIFDAALGAIVNTITVESASEQSLMKKFSLSGVPYVYVSNNTSDMKHNGDALNNVIDTLHTDINNVNNITEEIKTDVDALEDRVDNHDNELSNINATVKNHESEINAVKEDIIVIKSDVSGIKEDIQALEDSIQTTIVNYLAPIQAALDNLQAELATTKVELATTQAELATTKADLDETKTKLEAAQAEINTLNTTAITDITGVANEISVTVNNNTAVVGFAEDAYFVAG